MWCPVKMPPSRFSVFETVSNFMTNGNKVLQTFYGLEKCSYYDNPTCQVKINNGLSQKFVIEHGVRQGSILSPSMFLLLIDSLLHKLADSNAGITLENIYNTYDLKLHV